MLMSWLWLCGSAGPRPGGMRRRWSTAGRRVSEMGAGVEIPLSWDRGEQWWPSPGAAGNEPVPLSISGIDFLRY